MGVALFISSMPPSLSSNESTVPQAAAAPLVPAVARALTLLNLLAQRREPMSLTQLTSELALPKSSVHGLCNTLLAFGYLRRQPGGFFPGWATRNGVGWGFSR
ncbi:helix-turn-helix domain-containing protein [Variovorax sp. V512]|uniref:helix-turn-helix domain-containing protein n=1 Tax=Variovorax sp. V512 TaxID=3064160 RepID=UPI0034E8C8C9